MSKSLVFSPVRQAAYDADGDCEAACVATLTGFDLAEIPVVEGNGPEDGIRQVEVIRDWLLKRGFDYLHYDVILDADGNPPSFPDWQVPSGYWIASVVTPVTDEWFHAVVMRGREMVWNPDPRGGPTGDVMRLVRRVSILMPLTGMVPV